ncbi:OCR-like antirestriction protein [Streptomyces phage Goby]|nr:hypothetical protein KGH00_gp70 [Streptomyces phage Goby]AOQ27045.1 OCR-like antirestriction protein [Streptomyces phage Godpower]AWN07588.1 OCR-like antirestriction protein [Streptomyces phage Goby]AWN07664.1 OCR-like antirestriction protein [Streptomyces phage Toma]
MDIIESIKQRGAYSLASDADTLSPDDHRSAGALFLIQVRDSLLEEIEWRVNNGWTVKDSAEDIRDHDGYGVIADQAPSIYTNEVWKQFVDLGGYNEDLEPHDLNAGDLSKIPGIALYHIAWRLAEVLTEEIIESFENEEN